MIIANTYFYVRFENGNASKVLFCLLLKLRIPVCTLVHAATELLKQLKLCALALSAVACFLCSVRKTL